MTVVARQGKEKTKIKGSKYKKSVGGECRLKCHVTCDYDVSQRLDAFQQRAGISKI
jgi:hypothetical protein